MKRRILSLLLALGLLFSLIPAGVLAEALPTEPRTEAPVQETEDIPEESTAPEETVPEETEAPEETEETQPPETTLPEQTQPEETTPEETVPEQTVPETEPEEEEPESFEPVEVFFTVTVDEIILTLEKQELLAAQTLAVPNFDLTAYGLEAKTDGPTLAHLLIYATEVLYCGLLEQDAGHGYLAEAGFLGTEVLTLTETLERFWTLEGTLLCYVNGKLWDETEDADCTAISLEEKDSILLACVPREIAVEAGILAETDGIITAEPGQEVFYAPTEEAYRLGGDVTSWYSAGFTDELGQLHWEAPAPGEYCLAIPAVWEEETLYLTAAIPFVLEEEETAPEETIPQIPGDVNGDGVLDQTDGASLAGYINGTVTLPEDALLLGDMDGDGKINMLDVALIYRSLSEAQ